MAEGKEKATENEPRFNINAVTDAANIGSNSLRMSTNSTDRVDRFFQQIQWLRKTYLPDVIILYRRSLESIRQAINAEAATKAQKCRVVLEKIIRFLRMSRTGLMRCSEGFPLRFMNHIVLYIERAKAMNPAPLQNHTRTPTLQQNGNCLQFYEPEPVQNHTSMDAPQLLMRQSTSNLQASCVNFQSRFESSTGKQNSDPPSFTNSFQCSQMESRQQYQVDSPQITSHSLMQLEPKDLSSQLSGCTPPFLSTASPSAVPSSTRSSILADQEMGGPLSFHPLSLKESNRVTEEPIGPSPRRCESSCMVDYQSSHSEADPSQHLVKLPHDMLLQEIREIKKNLIETVVDVVDVEDISQTGCIKETVVRCSYSGVRCNGNINMLNASMQPFPSLLLELIVPANYPNSSPIILERFHPGRSESEEVRAVRKKATSKFSSSLWNFSRPISLTNMAKTWDVCAREEYREFAWELGGGDFSSTYGNQEDSVNAN